MKELQDSCSRKHELPARHVSKLPDFLYPLSFCGPIPNPWRHPAKFASHPIPLYALGVAAALVAAAGSPGICLLSGWWTSIVTGKDSKDAKKAGIALTAWIMALMGLGRFVSCWTFLFCFLKASETMASTLCGVYVQSVVTQDQTFFDKHGPGEISGRASKDIDSIRTAYGDKMGFIIYSIAPMIPSLILAFCNAARLAGVVSSVVPMIILVIFVSSWIIRASSARHSSLRGRSDSLVEQILSSMRVVRAFSMESSLIKTLDQCYLQVLEKMVRPRGWARAFEQAGVSFFFYIAFSLYYWFAGIEVVRTGLSIRNAEVVFWCMFDGAKGLVAVVPLFSGLTNAQVAIRSLRQQIERTPIVDIQNPSGLKLAPTDKSWAPAFEINNVTFAYPSRPNTKSLDSVSLAIRAGAMTAIVGRSGSGKSTLVRLLLRDYDPGTGNLSNPTDGDHDNDSNSVLAVDVNHSNIGKNETDLEKAQHRHGNRVQGSGEIFFAGRNIRDYNLKWYRQQSAVVSQDLRLFSQSIFSNVAVGLAGTEWQLNPDDDLTDSSNEKIQTARSFVEDALRKAEAWTFVCKLPEGMDTVITGRAAQMLSGGQRQRIALARALVRKPSVLILDEATSALDTASEERIRMMLDKEQAERGMTLIVIAHRLSTIKSAANIIVMADGQVVDSGTYEELSEAGRRDQTFRNMVLAVSLRGSENPESSAMNEPRKSAAADSQAQPEGQTQTLDTQDDKTETSKPSDMSQHVIDTTTHTCQNVNSARTTKPSIMLVAKTYWHLLGKQCRALFLLGFVCTIIVGGGTPMYGLLMGHGVAAIGTIGDNAAVRIESQKWSFWLLIFAIAAFLGLMLSGVVFELTAERVYHNVKRKAVSALTQQEIAMFESDAQTDAGSLTAALTTHPANITEATGRVLDIIVRSLVQVFSSMVLAFVLAWKVAAVGIPPILVVIAGAGMNVVLLGKYERELSGPANRASSFLSESIDVIQTVAHFNYQDIVIATFRNRNALTKRSTLSSFWGSFGFALTEGVMFEEEAIMYFAAGSAIINGDSSTPDAWGAFSAVLCASRSAGVLLMYVGDISRVFKGMHVMQGYFDRKPLGPFVSESRPMHETTENFEWGRIELRGIELRYPQWPDRLALQNLNLSILPGQTHALCGSSGSGKSTILALLLRFYEPCQGTLTFGGIEANDVALSELRSKCAYVSQDPQLFEGTIRWNLSLGATDPSSVSQQALERACQQACILDFIRNLKDGFETEIGMKGAALSGGQRQRLCIARALIRNPQVLILDEATSALDTTSEHHVNQALANAAVGRTTIMVAHRLSTIRNADKIHVIEEGRVVEEGSHDELMARKGRYLELVEAQL